MEKSLKPREKTEGKEGMKRWGRENMYENEDIGAIMEKENSI